MHLISRVAALSGTLIVLSIFVLDAGVGVFLASAFGCSPCLVQGLSNLLVEEDKVEEEITDVESELEVLTMQVGRLTLLCAVHCVLCAAV